MSNHHDAPKEELRYLTDRKTHHVPIGDLTGEFSVDKHLLTPTDHIALGASETFKQMFAGGIEKVAVQDEFRSYTPTQEITLDSEIIADLGGAAAAEMSLSEVWRFLVAQAHGEEGPLITTGYANVFYVKDVGQILRCVGVSWVNKRWQIGSHNPDDEPFSWGLYDRVFARVTP